MKQEIKLSCTMNMIMSIAMNITVNCMNHTMNASFISFRTLVMILLGFIIGEILSFIVPIARMRQGENRYVTSCLIGALNTIVISFVMTWINVRVIPIVIQVYLQSLLPLFIVSTLVAIIAEPIVLHFLLKKY